MRLLIIGMMILIVVIIPMVQVEVEEFSCKKMGIHIMKIDLDNAGR